MSEEEILGESEDTLATEEETKEEEKSEESTSLATKEDKTEDKEDPDKSKDSQADEGKGAPEEYSEFTLPEGMEHVEEEMKEATTIFKELNLSQEQAQKIVNLNSTRLQTEADAQAKVWNDTMDEWKKGVEDDKEYGGAKLDESLVSVRKAVSAFGSDDFKDMLDTTGVGNHPEMIRYLIAVGNTVKEDDILHGNSSGGVDKTQAEIMFPNMNHD